MRNEPRYVPRTRSFLRAEDLIHQHQQLAQANRFRQGVFYAELLRDSEDLKVVDSPADGREGVELYKEDSVDLVLMDLIMPEKEGIQAAAELRHYDPEVKIIAISGGGRIGNFQVLRIAQKFGIEHALPKPIRLGKLLALVEDVLDENE